MIQAFKLTIKIVRLPIIQMLAKVSWIWSRLGQSTFNFPKKDPSGYSNVVMFLWCHYYCIPLHLYFIPDSKANISLSANKLREIEEKRIRLREAQPKPPGMEPADKVKVSIMLTQDISHNSVILHPWNVSLWGI